MSYKNNHYVPRLVLRRFADKVSVYNIKTGELAENKRLEKVFALSELYSEEVEKELAEKIESPFALILNNKILSSNVGYSWGIIRVGSLLPTRFSFPHAILMRFNPNRIVAN